MNVALFGIVAVVVVIGIVSYALGLGYVGSRMVDAAEARAEKERRATSGRTVTMYSGPAVRLAAISARTGRWRAISVSVDRSEMSRRKYLYGADVFLNNVPLFKVYTGLCFVAGFVGALIARAFA